MFVINCVNDSLKHYLQIHLYYFFFNLMLMMEECVCICSQLVIGSDNTIMFLFFSMLQECASGVNG